MMMKWIVTALALLLPAAAADAATYTCQGKTVQSNSGPPTCSLGLWAAGTCNGQDQLPLQRTNSGKGWETPWEPFPILIKAINIAVFQDPVLSQTGFQYIFAGNSYSPDMMAELAPYEASRMINIPGNGFPFPASGTPGNDHIDLHVACAAGSYQIHMIVYYQPDLG